MYKGMQIVEAIPKAAPDELAPKWINVCFVVGQWGVLNNGKD
jgi:hypothetical protein